MTKIGQVLVNKGRIEGKIEGRIEGRIEGMVSCFKDMGFLLEDTIAKIAEKMGNNTEELRKEIIKYWNE